MSLASLVLTAVLGAVSPAAACQVVTSGVAFGVVDVVRGSYSNGEIAVSCMLATAFEIAIIGNGVPGARYMTGPDGGRLAYDLYPDATHAIPWSDGHGAGMGLAGTSDGSKASRFTVYGRIPVQPAVPPGTYSDSLTVIVNF